MPLFDMPLEKLQSYLPERNQPADFLSFWEQTLAAARRYDLNPTFAAIDVGLRTVESYDVSFSGFGGVRVRG